MAFVMCDLIKAVVGVEQFAIVEKNNSAYKYLLNVFILLHPAQPH